MKNIIYVLLLILITPSILFSGEPDKTLHEKCLYPTVLILSSAGGSGTGVIVRSEKTDFGYYNVILTCAHILKKYEVGYKAVVSHYKDSSVLTGAAMYSVQVLDINVDSDIAILCFHSDNKMPSAEIGLEEKLYIGNDVFSIGCGNLEPPRLDYGKITRLPLEIFQFGVWAGYRMSIVTIPGDSGSPVFHNNKLVGIRVSIVKMKIDNEAVVIPNISYAVPIYRFKNWIGNGDLGFTYDSKIKVPLIHILKYQIMKKV